MRIDVHAHYWAPDYLKCLRELTGSEFSGRGAGAHFTLDERVPMLREVGIDRQVLSLGTAMPYLRNEADAIKATTLANDSYAQVTRDYDGQFAGFGAVPLPHVDAAMREAARCLDELGMLGIALGCSIGERALDDAAFEPFWAELSRRNTVVFLHPIGRCPDPLLMDYDLPAIAGLPAEDTQAALRLILSGVTERHGGLRIIVPHLGGMLPTLWDRLERRGKSHLVRQLHYDTATCHGAGLVAACQTFGADRIMLGTDFPYVIPVSKCVTYVQEAGLSREDTDAILDTNAARLLGL